MKKYELLNQKQQQMEQLQQQLSNMENEKKNDRKTAEELWKAIKELCAEWNWTLGEVIGNMQQTTNISINKGKIVEVQTTKEVVVDNTDTTIEMLRETIRNMNQTINDMNKEHDELYKLYLEEQREKVIWAAAHDELKEQYEILEEEYMELELNSMTLKGKCLAYEQDINELKDKLNKQQVKSYVEIFNDPAYNEIEEESDAVSLFNIPEEYKDNQEIKSIVEKKTEEYNNAQGFGAGPFQVTAEQEREEIIRQTNKAIQKYIDEMKKTDDYEISLTKLYDKKNQVVTAVKGHITLAGRKYAFKYGATHENPCVYGCMDMNLITEAKKVLDSVSGMIKDTTEQKHAYDVVYAFDKGYVVWQAEDGCYKGYTKDYAFSWDGKQAQPCGATLMNAIENKPFRPMNKSWGNGFVKRANEIMAFCKTIDKYFKSTKEEPEETNEIVVNTNDVALNVTKEVNDLDI